MQGHSSRCQQRGAGCSSVSTPSSSLPQCWAGGERRSQPLLLPTPQPGGNGSGLGTDEPTSVFRHTLNLAIHLAEQLPDTNHGLPHAQATQTGGEQSDTTSQPDHASMKDAEVDDFEAPLMDFRNVL